jgi:putative phosphoribosyl transferase
MPARYIDRRDGARALIEPLRRLAGRTDVLVLALPRGGVPIGFELARELGAPLDLMLVRKLGVPGHEELAMGAIASGGVRVTNPEIAAQVPDEDFARVAETERAELRRRETAYRGDRPPAEVQGRCVVLVDDGVATGATMKAAIRAVRALGAARVIVAVPLAPRETVAELRALADDVVCPESPEPFFGIGQWYERFEQLDDDDVRDTLRRAWE